MGFGSSETVAVLEAYKQANDLTWTFAEGPDQMAREFRVVTQSTGIGIGSDGEVLIRKGYGTMSPGQWGDFLDVLAGS